MSTDPAIAAEPGNPPAHALTPTPSRSGNRDLASAVYGSLLVVALVAAQARSTMGVEFIAATLLVSVGVFWLTEVWSELVSRRVNGPISRSETLHIARLEAPMLSAAVLPALALGTAWVGFLAAERAIDLALAVGIGQLFAWGLAVGRALGRGWAVALVVAAVDCCLGLLIVALKVSVLH